MEYLKEADYMSDYEKRLIAEYNENISLMKNNIGTLMVPTELRNREILDELNELDTFVEDILFEMSMFSKEKSGLPLTIWIDDAGDYRSNTHHVPRIKVLDPDDKRNYISVSISKDPKILAGKFKKLVNLKELFSFIRAHYDDLIKVWNQEIDAVDFINKYRIDGMKEDKESDV